MCTVMDVCMAGACAAGSARSCDDNNMCTMDTCDQTQGCVNTQVPNCPAGAADAGVDASVDAMPDSPSAVPDARSVDSPPATTVDAARPDGPAAPADARVEAAAAVRDVAASADTPRATPVDMAPTAPRDTGAALPPVDGGGAAGDGGLTRDARDGGAVKKASGSSGCSCEIGGRESGGTPLLLLGLAASAAIGLLRRSRSRGRPNTSRRA
jgi:hypothetical protein